MAATGTAALTLPGKGVAASNRVANEPGGVVWEFETGRAVESSPTVLDGTVYVGSNDGNLYALDASNGASQWEFMTEGPVPSSPTVVDNVVYVASEDGTIYAVDADSGDERWSYSAIGLGQSSPTVWRNRLVVGSSSGTVHAIDTDTGDTIWTHEALDGITTAPTIADESVYLTSWDGSVFALDLTDGTLEWEFQTGDIIFSSPTVVGDSVFVGSRDGYIYGIRGSSGTVRWRNPVGDNVNSSPTVLNDIVYVGSATHRSTLDELREGFVGDVVGIDVWTGTTEFSFSTPAEVRSSPTGMDNRIIVGDMDGTLYVFDVLSEDVLRQFETDGRIHSSPTIWDGIAYVGSGDRSIYAFDVGSGVSEDSRVALGTLGHHFEWSETAAMGEDTATDEPMDEQTDDEEAPGQTQIAGDDGVEDGLISSTGLAILGGMGGLLALAGLGGYAVMRRSGPRTEESSLTDDAVAAESDPHNSGDVTTNPKSTPASESVAVAVDEDEGEGEGDGEDEGQGEGEGDAHAPADSEAETTAPDEFDIEATVERMQTLRSNAQTHREENRYDRAVATCWEAIADGNECRDVAVVKQPHRVPEIDEQIQETADLRDELTEERSAYRDAWERVQKLNSRLEDIRRESDVTGSETADEWLDGMTTELKKIERIFEGYGFEGIAGQIASIRDERAAVREEMEATRKAYERATKALEAVEHDIEECEETVDDRSAKELRNSLASTGGTLDEISSLAIEYDLPTIEDRLEELWTRWEQLEEIVAEEAELAAHEPESVPSAPRIALEYDDLERVDQIGVGGNADVYRAIVRDSAGEEMYVAVKEPRMAGALHDGTVEHPPTSAQTQVTRPSSNLTAADQPTRTGANLPGSSDVDDRTRRLPGDVEDPEEAQTRVDREHRNQLIEEAEKWQKLDDHDHIVDIVAFGKEPLPWIAMEYMDAGHVGHWAGQMDIGRALWTAISVTKAVRHAHRRGVAHLDLKPENVLFRRIEDAWDVPKVGDWGLSKLLLNHSQSIAGLSTHYAAPEQFDRAYGEADDITDVYQLGTVFYELFTGQKPFQGNPAQVMNQVLHGEVSPPSDVANIPEELDEILLRAMSKEKADRYESVLYLRDDLQSLRERI